MTSDLFIIAQWWLVLFIIGLGVLPLASFLFPRFVDRGYIFAKTLGMMLLSYVMLVLGTVHLVPFTTLSVYVVFLIGAGAIWYGVNKYAPVEHRPLFALSWRYVITEEILFFLVLLMWSYIRGFQPDINGLEKFMDYGFVNSILRATYFPPKDMWFTPLPINYYYFGHLVTAVLTKLSFLPSSYTYNLMIATLASLCFGSVFSIGATLYQQVNLKLHFLKYFVTGLLTAIIVTFGGNLHTLYAFFQPYQPESPLPPWRLVFSPSTFPNSYWYPNATRFIYHTIHEFPIYSWTVSDLHGHVLDIPFVLLTIAYLLSLFLNYLDKPQLSKSNRKSKQATFVRYYHLIAQELPLPLGLLLLISFFLSVMYMTNAWDGIIYFLLALLVFAALKWRVFLGTAPLLTRLFRWAVELIVPAAVLGIGFLVFSLPFSLFFKPFVSGIGILCAPKFLTDIGKIGPFLFEANHCLRSPWWQLVILYGFFYFFAVVFVIFLWKVKKLFRSDIFILLLISLSTILITIPEFIYVKDIYPAHYRANTMFKLVFEAFIMLGISSGYIIARVASYLKEKKTVQGRALSLVFYVCCLILLSFTLSFPYFAIMSYYNNLQNYRSLNGIAYLSTKYPTDAKAIAWLTSHIKGQPVILEAQGDSYTDYARVSANTGLPTVLGWTVHEWLWRGSYDVPAPRITDVVTMYTTPDLQQTKDLLQKYHVQYVFIGDLEREKYPMLIEDKFAKLGKVIYQDGSTKIYKLGDL